MDEADDEKSMPLMPEIGTVYHFQGKPLEPYSPGRDSLMARLTFDPISEGEAHALLVFICTQPESRCVMVRTKEEVAAFRLEESRWRQAIGWLGKDRQKVREELRGLYEAITGQVKQADILEPEPPKPSRGALPEPVKVGKV